MYIYEFGERQKPGECWICCVLWRRQRGVIKKDIAAVLENRFYPAWESIMMYGCVYLALWLKMIHYCNTCGSPQKSKNRKKVQTKHSKKLRPRCLVPGEDCIKSNNTYTHIASPPTCSTHATQISSQSAHKASRLQFSFSHFYNLFDFGLTTVSLLPQALSLIVNGSW